MDAHTDWAASALFSPSKARVQQAQAKDWAAVDAWLAKKYGAKRPPPFEKNEETLQALLTLANLNDSADEQRSQFERIEKNALSALSKKPTKLAQEILSILLNQLANDDRLDTLSELAVALDSRGSDAFDIGKDITALLAEEFEAKQRLIDANAQLSALKREKAQLTTTLNELRSDAFKAPDDAVESTNDWTKSAKHLRAKIAEYDERLASVRRKSSSNHIELVQQRATEVDEQRLRLEQLQSQLKALRNLPPDMRSAQAVLEEAREQLRSLHGKRDRLFESMLDS